MSKSKFKYKFIFEDEIYAKSREDAIHRFKFAYVSVPKTELIDMLFFENEGKEYFRVKKVINK